MKETGILIGGGTLLYPTDTIWGLGCDATNEIAINRISTIKGRNRDKNFIVLVSDLDMLSNYVEKIPPATYDLLNRISNPLTIIYPNPKNLPLSALSTNGKLGIRIPNHDYCQALLRSFGKPIVSTSANLSGQSSPRCFEEIDMKIRQAVDFIADVERKQPSTNPPSLIYIIEDGEVIRLR